jgi:Flp pilus assembly protein CpaB
MAVSTARPSVTPLVSWDKAQQQTKPAPKKSSPMLTAVVVAIIVLAIVGLWRAFNKPAAGQSVQVMSARNDIPVGSRLGITNITFLDVPKQYLSSDMIVSLNDATGRVARTFIPAGEPIKDYMLFRGSGGLSSNIDIHERAITLQLDDDALVDHAIMPEDRVDILVVSSKKDKKFTKTVCQAVRVLMTSPKEQMNSRRGASGNKITLAVPPDLAEIVNEATEVGKIRLTLRSRLSRIEQKLTGAKPEDLIPASASLDDPIFEPIATTHVSSQLIPAPPPALTMPPAPAPDPVQWMVEVISGNHRENYAVPEK